MHSMYSSDRWYPKLKPVLGGRCAPYGYSTGKPARRPNRKYYR